MAKTESGLVALERAELTAKVEPLSSEGIPVIVEELQISKRVVEEGVRLDKTVQTSHEQVAIPLATEEIEIRRVPVNRPVDGPVAVRQEGDTLIIPLFEEVVVVQKQLYLREEIHVIKRKQETEHTEQVTLRREEVNIQPLA